MSRGQVCVENGICSHTEIEVEHPKATLNFLVPSVTILNQFLYRRNRKWLNSLLEIELLKVFLAVDRMKSELSLTLGLVSAVHVCRLCVVLNLNQCGVVWYRILRVNI